MKLSAAPPVDEATVAHPTDLFSHRALLQYLLVLLLPVLALMLIAIPWTRYAPTAPGKWMMSAMDFRYSLRGVNADIVITGDSTGLVSLDPVVMQQQLHRSVVNVASLRSIFNVQPDDMLEHYLRYNTPPKVLIVSLSPWSIRPEPVTSANSFEGIVMLARHGTWPQIFHFVWAHPMVTLNFEFQALRSLLDPLHRSDPELQKELVEHRGFAPIHPPSLHQPCTLKPYVDPEIPDGLAVHYYRKFSSAETRVLIYMAPVADCAGSEQFRNPHPHSGWLVPSAVVPATDICEDGLHAESYAATRNSQSAAMAIEQYLAADPSSLP